MRTQHSSLRDLVHAQSADVCLTRRHDVYIPDMDGPLMCVLNSMSMPATPLKMCHAIPKVILKVS